MRQHPPQPLSPEERALSDRLLRLGPSGEPSPALDASILAAARMAATAGTGAAGAARPESERRRRFGRIALPGALVTGMGMAASLVLALGLAWQIRPGTEPLNDRSSAPSGARGEETVVAAQMLDRQAPAGDAAPAPPPRVVMAPTPTPTPTPAPAPAAAEAPRPPRPEDDASAPAPSVEAGSRQRAATGLGSASAKNSAVVDAAPVDAAPLAETVATDPSASASASSDPQGANDLQASPPRPAPAAAPRRPSYTTSARAAAARAERTAQSNATDPTAGATPLPAAGIATQPRVDDEPDRGPSALSSWAEISPDLDRLLDPAAWMQRIRERRDGGDTRGASESLKLFRSVHPHARVPRDLRTLEAASPAQ